MNPLPSAFVAVALLAACARHDGDEPQLRPPVVPAFETRTEIGTGTGQHADFVVADLDNDRQVDLAVIGLSGELQVMIGANGTFAPGQSLQLGGVPLWMDAGDLDGDGDLDLAVLRTDAGEVSILHNDGNAQFAAGPVLGVGAGALTVLIADADDDGVPDVIVSRPDAPEVLVWLNDGTGALTPGSAFTLPGGGSPFTMVVGDVTRDTFSDLVVSDPVRDRVLVFPGSQQSLDFEPVPYEFSVAGSPKACSLGDLNGDGLTDLAVSAFDANEFVLITDFTLPPGGGVTPYTSSSVPLSGPPSLSMIADVTGDGRADLIACVVSSAAVVIVPQLPGGGLGAPVQLDAGGLPLHPAVADVDDNGYDDLFVLSGLHDRINLWLARDDGELAGARSYDTGLTTAAYTQIVDLDLDGHVEVIVGNNYDSRLSIMRHQADGSLRLEDTIELGDDVFNLRQADLDGDGRVELLVPVSSGIKVVQNLSTPGNVDMSVRPGLGSLSFGVGAGPFGVAAADLDGDTRVDLAVVNFASGELQVLMATAVPFEFAAPRVVAIGAGPVDVVAGEFSGDGIVDLAVSRSTRSDIVLLENDGQGDLSVRLSIPVGASPNYLLTADFDRDGHTDIVVSNGSDSSITVLFGGAQAYAGRTYQAGQAPTALLAADMNLDGAPDILVTSLLGADFRMLVNGGDGSFPEILEFPGTVGASAAAMGDVDRDGDADLVIASLVSDRLSVVRAVQ